MRTGYALQQIKHSSIISQKLSCQIKGAYSVIAKKLKEVASTNKQCSEIGNLDSL